MMGKLKVEFGVREPTDVGFAVSRPASAGGGSFLAPIDVSPADLIFDSYPEHLDPVAYQALAEIDAEELERERARVAPRVAERLMQPTRGVGKRLRDVTEDDGGQALRWRLNEPATATALRAWWWQRRPTTIPWTP